MYTGNAFNNDDDTCGTCAKLEKYIFGVCVYT